MDDERRLGLGVKIGYGLGSVGTGVFATVPGLLLLYYMTDTLGISAEMAGFAVVAPKLWDVVTDPLMGVLSDRTRSRWGRRRPWLLAGAIALPVTFALLFAAPTSSPQAGFWWVLAFYTLAATAFTAFSVPYVSLPAEMTSDAEDTTRLVSFRIAALTVGLLLAGALAPLVVKAAGGGAAGYRVMGVTVAAACLLAMVGSVLGTWRVPLKEAPAPGGVGQALSEVFAAARNVPFRQLWISYFLQLVGVGCLLANVPYLAKYLLGGDEGTVTNLFLCLVLPAALTMPLGVWISRRRGTHRAYMLAVGVFGVSCLAVWPLIPLGAVAVYPAVLGMGIGYAGSQLFPFSMLPDTQRLERETSGVNREGVLTGLWMAGDKGGMAVGALVASQVLGAAGFVEAVGGAAQPDSALRAIAATMSALPGFFLLGSLVVLRRYRLGGVPQR